MQFFMESYATALLYAIPFFLVLLLAEVAYGYICRQQKHKVLDTVSSVCSGITNIVKDSLGIGLVVVSYPYLLQALAVTSIRSTWLVWFLAFIAIDFAGYWNHRLSHKVNLFWNQHVIHHSSEEFNLACALRQPVSNLIGYFGLLLLPAALLGIPNEVIAILAPLHLFAQFWYHTQHIGKMGWLEYVIVTPSQHRVHHAINPEYIDKNLGQVLCIWDRWFGTFQEELPGVPPRYGVLKPAATWNPLYINFQHVWRLMQDAWRTRSYRDKFRIWFMPTGWRPEDVKARFPHPRIANVYDFRKYQTPASSAFKIYLLFQLASTLGLVLFMFYNYADIGFDGLLLYGAFIFASIYGLTSLMDRHRYALWIEWIRSLAGLLLIGLTGDWFGLDDYWQWASTLVVIYLVGTLAGSVYFSYWEERLIDSNKMVLK